MGILEGLYEGIVQISCIIIFYNSYSDNSIIYVRGCAWTFCRPHIRAVNYKRAARMGHPPFLLEGKGDVLFLKRLELGVG